MRPVPFIAGVLTISIFVISLLLSPATSLAQEPAPVGNVANGILVYQQRCANCHGPIGMGDGELAVNLPNPPTAIGSVTYLEAAIPNAMFDTITNGNVSRGMPLFGEGSSNPLSEQERWDVISAAFALGTSAEPMREASMSLSDSQRMLLESTDWAAINNAAVALQLAEDVMDAETTRSMVNWGRMMFSAEYFLGRATVRGTVFNGTLNQPQADGDVTLIAFEGFDRAAAFSGPVDENGRFEIVIDDVPADWFGRVESTYSGIDYTGEFLRFSSEALDVESDVTVYNTTDNAGGLQLELFNTVLEFAVDAVVVNQLYAFGNVNTQAFVGGIEYGLPDSAENVAISRVEADQFFPVQLNADGQDDVVIFPGNSGLTTFLRYTIPYDGEVSLAHPLDFSPRRAALAVPAGIGIGGENWTFRETDTTNGTAFDNYNGNFVDSFTVDVSGFPEFATDANSGERILIRDEQQELLIGGAALLVVVAGSLFVARSWQQQQSADPTQLLQEIADLDDAYAAKQLKRKPYQARRKELMQKVRDNWG